MKHKMCKPPALLQNGQLLQKPKLVQYQYVDVKHMQVNAWLMQCKQICSSCNEMVDVNASLQTLCKFQVPAGLPPELVYGQSGALLSATRYQLIRYGADKKKDRDQLKLGGVTTEILQPSTHIVKHKTKEVWHAQSDTMCKVSSEYLVPKL